VQAVSLCQEEAANANERWLVQLPLRQRRAGNGTKQGFQRSRRICSDQLIEQKLIDALRYRREQLRDLLADACMVICASGDYEPTSQPARHAHEKTTMFRARGRFDRCCELVHYSRLHALIQLQDGFNDDVPIGFVAAPLRPRTQQAQCILSRL